jgi:hypothetical protein
MYQYSVMDNNLENQDREAEAYLHKLKEMNLTSGFSTPEGYFDQLKEETLSRISLEQLKEKVGESGFEVPDGYFQALGPKIFSRLSIEEEDVQPPAKVVKLWQSSVFKYASAACFVLVIASGIYFNEKPAKSSIASISTTDQYLYEIDEDYIIDDLDGKKELTHTPITAATNNEIESYILNNYSQSDISSSL